jgi:hypothetical protein
MATCPNHVPLNQPKDKLDATPLLHNDVRAQWHFMCARPGSKAGADVRRKAQGMNVLVYVLESTNRWPWHPDREHLNTHPIGNKEQHASKAWREKETNNMHQAYKQGLHACNAHNCVN